jgi:outer membrane protein OmpA-like peptidoglycan-associated protein
MTHVDVRVRRAFGFSLALLVALPAVGAAADGEPAPAAASPLDPARAAAPLSPLYDATTDVGHLRRLRLALEGDYAKASGLLVPGDSDKRLRLGVVAAYAPADWLDLFASVLGSSNRNQRKQADRVDPELIRAQGDFVLGAKGRWAVGNGLSLAFVAADRLRSGDSLLFDFDASTYWLGPLVTYDVHQGMVRLSVGGDYVIDHSSKAVTLPADPQSRYVVSYANGIGYNRFRYGAAVDHVFRPSRGPAFVPYLRFHGEHVTASADPVLAMTGKERNQSGLQLGLRSQLTAELALELAGDIRLGTMSPGYGAPSPPFTTFLALTYSPGAAEAQVVETTRVVRVEIPASPGGTVSGRVEVASTRLPLPGAIVSVVGHAHARVATDADGTFLLRDLPPGVAELSIEALGFEPRRVPAEVPASGDKFVSLSMSPRPTAVTGQVRGHVLDDVRHGVAGAIAFSGANDVSVRAGADGAFALSLPPGHYSARVTADGHLSRIVPLDVSANESTIVELALRRRPAVPNVVLGAHGLDVKSAIAFDGASSELTMSATLTLDEVADLLIAHPEKRRIRIEARWDSSLANDAALSLTTAQANAVRDYLVGAGVDAGRLEAAGMGATKAAAGGGRSMMQILRSGRALNKRVDFVFVE